MIKDSPLEKEIHVLRACGLLFSRQNVGFRKQLSEHFRDLRSCRKEVLSLPEVLEWKEKGALEVASEKIIKWEQEGIRVISIWEQNYPARLAGIHSPPFILFYKGDLRVINSQVTCVSIVGARKSDFYGNDFAERTAEELASRGISIISGLAYGIDINAHAGALKSEVPGVAAAILGNALPGIYPVSHHRISERIIDSGGIIISQFEPGMKTFPSHFLDRNRVVAGLSSLVLVVQAAKRSGSLATARYALEEGREVMAVPGRVGDRLSEGCNYLIRQGAGIVTGTQDIIDALPQREGGYPVLADADTDSELEVADRELLRCFQGRAEIHIDQLRAAYQGSTFELSLMNLEMAELIGRRPGNCIAVTLKGGKLINSFMRR